MSLVTTLQTMPIRGVYAVGNVTPAQPPGTDKITTLLQWTLWGVSIACVLGVLVICGMMAVSHHRGESAGHHLGKLGAVFGGALLSGAAAGMVTAITG